MSENRELRKDITGNEEDCKKRSYIISILHQFLLIEEMGRA
jgi:hypothetical protein